MVIILNGMSNFNLVYEILGCARLSMQQNDINGEVLHSVTKSYESTKLNMAELVVQ